MHHPSTPVKRTTSFSKITVTRGDDVIKRPSDGNRRVSAPIEQIAEDRVAPSEVFGAPKTSRIREAVPHTTSTIAAATTSSTEQTPRRRSTQLVNVQKTPTKTSKRRHSEAAGQESEALRAFAPLRAHREETRELARTNDIMYLPCF